MHNSQRILAHRGNVDGPSPAENSLPGLRQALERGWGLETDIRRHRDGRFYISHDPRARVDGVQADAFCRLFRDFPAATIALNVKEPGGEEALLAYLDAQRVLDQVFLFDMELCEEEPGRMARRFRDLHPTVRIAARVSDRREPIARALAVDAASVIWLDEFDRLWCTEEDVRRLKDAGRTVYAVSPELHDFPANRTKDRWLEFLRWGVDGICTDYPATLDAVYRAREERAA